MGGETEVCFCKRVLESVKVADLEGNKVDDAATCWHFTLEPGQAMMVPAGVFTVEATVPLELGAKTTMSKDHVRDSYVIGFRLHFAEGDSSPGQTSLKELAKEHSSRAKANCPTVKFWKAIIESS